MSWFSFLGFDPQKIPQKAKKLEILGVISHQGRQLQPACASFPLAAMCREEVTRKWAKDILKLASTYPQSGSAGCGGGIETLLSPKGPTMLSIWHVRRTERTRPHEPPAGSRVSNIFGGGEGHPAPALTNAISSTAISVAAETPRPASPARWTCRTCSQPPADASALGIEGSGLERLVHRRGRGGLCAGFETASLTQAAGENIPVSNPQLIFRRLPVRPALHGPEAQLHHLAHMDGAGMAGTTTGSGHRASHTRAGFYRLSGAS